MKTISDTQPATPFEKFKQLTERLVAVPKKELDERLKDYADKKKTKKQKGKS